MTSVKNVLEHSSLDEDLVDRCLIMKKEIRVLQKRCVGSVSMEKILLHFTQHH